MIAGILSDTHGSRAALRRALAAVPDADCWLHAGDYSQDADCLRQLTDVPVYAACGNCDGYETSAKIDEYITLEGRSIWLTHGHHYAVKRGMQELRYWAHRYEADLVVFGHTHLPVIHSYDKRIFLNPGSAAYSGSCARVKIDDSGIEAEILPIK